MHPLPAHVLNYRLSRERRGPRGPVYSMQLVSGAFGEISERGEDGGILIRTQIRAIRERSHTLDVNMKNWSHKLGAPPLSAEKTSEINNLLRISVL